MATKWIKTTFSGVRYRKHPSRKHGVNWDQYFTIRYKVPTGEKTAKGKDITTEKEEGLGWASKGWTAKKAYKLLEELQENRKAGQGPQTLSEKRDLAASEREQAEADNVTFGHYFEKTYFPTFQVGRKKSTTCKAKEHFKNWLEPVIGNTPLKMLKPLKKPVQSNKKNIVKMSPLDRIAKNILDKGRSPRTLQYVMATVRQVWNTARRDGLVDGDTPTRNITKPKFDNRRVRFLSHKEADKLLNALQAKDTTAHNMALLSLHTGLRVGEMMNLKWSHIDAERGLIRVMDAKGGFGRAVYMTKRVKAMFEGMTQGEPEELVFKSITGKPLKEMPRVYFEVVAALKFNEGITDARQKVVAHTLRHSFASWHVTAGTEIYTLKELLGHSIIQMTERYSHLAPATLQNATKNIERAIKSAEEEKAKEQFGQVVNFKK
jgi:integrase